MVSQVVAGTPVAVTSSTTSTLPAPAGQATYGWTVVTNCSPWLATIYDAEGTKSLQPFTIDVFLPPAGQGLGFAMSVPPSGSGTATAGQPAYLQGDWYVAQGSPPSDTYPISLTAQALIAAVTAQYQDIDLTPGGVPGATLSKTVTLPTNTQTLEVLTPSGTASTTVTATGTTTNTVYGNENGELAVGTRNRYRVSYAADPSITVAVTNPGGTWWIVASPAVLQVDAILYGTMGAPGSTAPPGIIQMGGKDGAGTGRALFTDASGHLEVLAGGLDGTPAFQFLSVTAPGAALPSEAQVVQAGSDGTDSRLLSTDSSGHLVLGTHFRPTGLTSTGIGASLAAGGTATIVAASAGKTITIYYLQVTITAGAATAGTYQVQFEGLTSGTIVGAGRPNIVQATAVGIGSAVAPIYLDFTGIGGFALTLGEGFEAVAAGGNAGAVVIEGVVIYTQA